MISCSFAIPGDLDSKTGGYLYDRNLIEALRAERHDVEVLGIGDSFPDPSPTDQAAALDTLQAVPPDRPIVVDGLLYGALPTEGLARIPAPMIALLHHPLGFEPGLTPARARALIAREDANLRLAAHVIVPSPHVARLLTEEFAVAEDRISVALPGFPRPEVRNLPKDDPPLILSVGLICARKGHDVLLEALARINDLDWQAAIVGLVQDSTLATSLQARCRASGLADRIRFTGCVTDAELQTLYARASLFALATRYEGYGMAFGEAMLNGLPIITCAAGAVPDTVPATAGILVPPDDPVRFADALRSVLSDPARRAALGQGAQRAGLALPTWSDTASIMANALSRVRRERRGD
jgi:glycosyltransferase involved in cell wall biosynthesis